MELFKRAAVIYFLAACVLFGLSGIVWLCRDRTPPQITGSGEMLYVKADCDEKELLAHLSASDDRDGDLTDQIRVRKISSFLEKGICSIEYIVFDKSSNAGTYERKVCFEDYHSPQFELSQPLLYGSNSTIAVSDRISVWDVMDGDITDRLKIVSGNINASEEGTYQVEVEVTNRYGDTSRACLPVNVVSQGKLSCPITLMTYLLYVEAGTVIEPAQFIASAVDANGQAIDRRDIVITQQVDLRNPGCGQYLYEIRDESGCVGMSCLTVIVTEG